MKLTVYRTIARSQEVEAEERASLRHSTSQGGRGDNFLDELDQRTADAAILRDDDIDFPDEETRHGYRDEFTDDEDDVFRHGDGEDEEAIGMDSQRARK